MIWIIGVGFLHFLLFTLFDCYMILCYMIIQEKQINNKQSPENILSNNFLESQKLLLIFSSMKLYLIVVFINQYTKIKLNSTLIIISLLSISIMIYNLSYYNKRNKAYENLPDTPDNVDAKYRGSDNGFSFGLTMIIQSLLLAIIIGVNQYLIE